MKDGYGNQCRVCQTAARRKYVFGLSKEQHQALYDKQNGCCAVCDRPEKDLTRGLSVDHDHQTGEIRGLLCGYCNHRVIGRHRKGGYLKRAADYLERDYTGHFVPEKFKKGQPKIKKRKKT